MQSRRIPRLALVAWVLAAAAMAGLAVAVAHYLGEGSSRPLMDMSGTHGMQGMAGMHPMAGMESVDALTRGGASATSEPLFGSAFFTAWQLDALALAVLVLLAAAYLTGVALVPSRSPGERWPWQRTASFFAGLAVIAFATNGSVAVYDQVLFTAHMVGHLLLLMVGPALLMFGRPLGLALAAAPPGRRATLGRALSGRVVSVLTAPPVVLALYTAVIVGSHLTGLMNTIMSNTWAGQLEHLVYLLTGCLFFVVIVGDEPIRWKLASPARWLLLALAMAVDTFVGIVLMQQTRPIALLSSALHVDALSDTHTGGAIMWFGGDAVMAAVMIALVVGWLRRIDTAPVELGWLEQARMATFTSHTGSGESAAGGAEPQPERDLDSDDAAHDAYNDWLAKLGNS